MNKAIRLEQLLQFWEDAVFRDVVAIRFFYRIGERTPMLPPREYRNVRQMLLRANSRPFDFAGYLPTGRYTMCDLDPVPFLLYQWCRSSRKMYHLSDGFREMLRQTTLDELPVGEVRLPFAAIAVSLETPIRHEASNSEFDVFVLWEERDGIGLQLLPRSLGDRRPMTREERDRLAIDAATAARGSRRQQMKMTTRLDAFAEANAARRVPFSISWSARGDDFRCSNREMMEAIRRAYSGFGECLAEAFLIGLGLGFYLTQPKGESRESIRTERLPATPDLGAVTSEAEVCYIDLLDSLTHASSFQEGEPTGPTAVSPSAHWRTGYWRRRPGQGDDPFAPRVVWVRPTIVRQDRLAEGELPLGKKYEV